MSAAIVPLGFEVVTHDGQDFTDPRTIRGWSAADELTSTIRYAKDDVVYEEVIQGRHQSLSRHVYPPTAWDLAVMTAWPVALAAAEKALAEVDR